MPDRCRAARLPQTSAEKQAMMAHCSVTLRQCVGWIERDRSFERYKRLRHLLRHAGIDIRLGTQDEVIGVEAVGPLAFDSVDLGAAQARRDSAHDRQSNQELKRENIIGTAIIVF